MDPTTAAWINAGSNVLGKALGGSSAPATSSAGGTAYLDTSGWSVAFGGNAASGGLPWYVFAGAAVLVLVWLKKKK